MLNGVRLVCTCLLHMMIMPEIKNSLELIRFSILNWESFNGLGKYFAVLILQMRLWACILTELLNIYKMGETDAIEDIVKDFIAFGIISDIDEVIVNSFLQLNVSEELKEHGISYQKEQDSRTTREMVEQVWKGDEPTYFKVVWIARIVMYTALQFFYTNFYFYFFPLLIVIWVF